jgi:hypothetical protein
LKLVTFELLISLKDYFPIAALWNRNKMGERHDYPCEIVDLLRYTTGDIAPPKAKNSLVVKIKPLGRKNLKTRFVRLD